MLALLGGQTKPARAVAEIVPRGVRRLQVKPRQIVLRVGVAEIGRGIGEHLPGAIGIGLDLGVRDAVEVVAPQRHEGIGDDRRLRRRRAVLGMRVGDAAEIFEGAQIVLDDAIAIGIHPAELPLRDGMATLGGVLQRSQRGRGNRSRGRRCGRDLLQGLGRDGLRGGGLVPHGQRGVRLHRRAIKCESRSRHRRGPQHQRKNDTPRCPHNTVSRAHRQDGLQPHPPPAQPVGHISTAHPTCG